jgi:hypothetical protein
MLRLTLRKSIKKIRAGHGSTDSSWVGSLCTREESWYGYWRLMSWKSRQKQGRLNGQRLPRRRLPIEAKVSIQGDRPLPIDTVHQVPSTYICGVRINDFWGYSLHRVVFPLCHIARTMGMENIGHPRFRLSHFLGCLSGVFDVEEKEDTWMEPCRSFLDWTCLGMMCL